MEEQNNNCCLGKILNLIVSLQKASQCEDNFDNSCTKPYLGSYTNIESYNTRPVTFYDCQNNLLSVEYTTIINDEIETLTSSIFRIEKVQNSVALVKILRENPNKAIIDRPYISTNQTASINLNCVCAIKCLPDTIIDL